LQASTTYYYYIKAKNSAGESGYSSYTSATTSSSGGGETSAPSAPTSVTATAQSSSSISVSWNSVSGASGYRVYRATSSYGSYSQIASPTTTSYTNTGLSASTTYYYKVSAYNSAGESAQSSYDYATTSSSSSSGDSTKPSTPTGVKATVQSSSSISVSWNSVSGAISYKIYRGLSASYTPSETPVTSASYTFTGLDSNTTYYFRITAINSNGESSQSSAVSAKTQAPPLQKPNAPYGSPVVNSQTTTSLTIGWPASSNATDYKLYRATGDSNSFTVVYTGSATTYRNTGVTSGVTYKYKVTATNSAGESEFSDVLTYRKQ
jgi:fibronectin type 3 domain-containing protein